ncbi:hypothetical protein BDZ91DRAFT_801426 [Kalaharituber pfeilii]|nr:hypothetical protein BDZ91DRAFT_801426 [Kalaharituber pfeilii]
MASMEVPITSRPTTSLKRKQRSSPPRTPPHKRIPPPDLELPRDHHRRKTMQDGSTEGAGSSPTPKRKSFRDSRWISRSGGSAVQSSSRSGLLCRVKGSRTWGEVPAGSLSEPRARQSKATRSKTSLEEVETRVRKLRWDDPATHSASEVGFDSKDNANLAKSEQKKHGAMVEADQKVSVRMAQWKVRCATAGKDPEPGRDKSHPRTRP